MIIVGIDGSETSMRAGAYAVGLARREGSRLIGVFVRPPAGGRLSFGDPFGAAIATAYSFDVPDTLRARLGADLEIVTRKGDPFAELCRVAGEMWADAVVVGRSASLLHRVTGSVGQRLVRCGRWPVTVVP